MIRFIVLFLFFGFVGVLCTDQPLDQPLKISEIQIGYPTVNWIIFYILVFIYYIFILILCVLDFAFIYDANKQVKKNQLVPVHYLFVFIFNLLSIVWTGITIKEQLLPIYIQSKIFIFSIFILFVYAFLSWDFIWEEIITTVEHKYINKLILKAPQKDVNKIAALWIILVLISIIGTFTMTGISIKDRQIHNYEVNHHNLSGKINISSFYNETVQQIEFVLKNGMDSKINDMKVQLENVLQNGMDSKINDMKVQLKNVLRQKRKINQNNDEKIEQHSCAKKFYNDITIDKYVLSGFLIMFIVIIFVFITRENNNKKKYDEELDKFKIMIENNNKKKYDEEIDEFKKMIVDNNNEKHVEFMNAINDIYEKINNINR